MMSDDNNLKTIKIDNYLCIKNAPITLVDIESSFYVY